MGPMPRRRLLLAGGALALVGGGTYAWLRAVGYDVDPDPDERERTARAPAAALPHAAFDPRAEAILSALADDLIPGDDALPSGRAARVPEFLAAVASAPGFLSVRNDLLKLSRHLDLRGKALGGKGYPELTSEERGQLLREAAELDPRTGRFSPARALELALRLSLEGYLGHPHHGGNPGFVTWDALAIDMPRERGTHHHP